MKFSKNEHIFWTSHITGILILSLLLYYDFVHEIDFNKGEKVAVLSYKRKTAQRKYESQVIWGDLEQENALYNRDTIRTSGDSEVEITLNDGTKIHLDENSMIILNISGENVNINYAYGSVRANRSSTGGDGGGEVQIITQDQKSIKITDSDVKLSQTDGKDVNVTVNRGTASVTADGKEQSIKKDELAVLSSDAVKLQNLTLKPIKPKDNTKFFTTGDSMSTSFAWETPEKKMPVTLEISALSNFEDIISSQTTEASDANVSLPVGNYYWRLISKDKKESSTVNKFRITHTEPLSFSSPKSGATIHYKKNEPLVNFTWNKNSFASSYNLEISNNPEFSNPTVIETRVNAISRQLQEGKYWFRLKTVSQFPEAEVSSTVENFSVARLEKLPAPELMEPALDADIGAILFETQGVSFSWKQNREIKRAELWISNSNNFENKTSEIAENNFYTMKQKMTKGIYYWKVRGVDENGSAITDFSNISSFKVSELMKIKLLSPSDGTGVGIISAVFPGVSFSWTRPGMKGQYRMKVSTSKDFSNTVYDEKLESASTSISLNKPGNYYWEIQFLNEKEVVISKSEIGEFAILNELESPLLLYPQEASVIDMAYQNALPFRWNPTEGADYYILRLYQGTGKNRKIILDKKLKETEYIFSQLELLDKSWFSWSLTAANNSFGKEVIYSKEISNKFEITLSNEPTISISPTELYIE